MRHPKSRTIAILLKYRCILIIGIQAVLMVLANSLAFWLRFDGAIPEVYSQLLIQMLPWLVAVRQVTFIPFRLYEGLWRYTSIWDLRNIIAGVLSSTVVFYALVHGVFGLTRYPRSVFIVDSVLLILFLGGIRLARRFYRELGHLERERHVLIFGAGDAGEMIVRDMKNSPYSDFEPVGFVDDDVAKIGQRIHGVRVLGTRQDLPTIMSTARPHEVLVAIPGAEPATVRGIVKALQPFKVPIRTVPSMRDILDGKVALGQIRNLAIEDLLARAPVGLNPEPVRDLVAGKRIMVTGAGGSIGSELCRQIAAFRPRALILYERYENGLYSISTELGDRDPSLVIHSVVGDVTDPVSVNRVMAEYRPEIVFHAAAHKHVPLMELNPCEAIKNNVVGTRTVAEAAGASGSERFILISSDKAVNPSSIMGASKRVAELIVQALSLQHETRFVVVRFGNVLGSSGSVVPRFIEQIKAGGPVTVTHPEVYRYFMLTSEAVQLVLHAATQRQTGVTYVLNMGEPLSVLEMARNLIRLSGLVPEEDIPITFVGLRPGEKLFEELIGSDEVAEPSGMKRILRVRPVSSPDPALFTQKIARLERLATEGRSAVVVEQLFDIVPTLLFRHGERRRRPPSYRTMLVRNTLPLLERCETAESLRALLEDVRKDLGFETLRVRVDDPSWRSAMNGVGEVEVRETDPFRDPNLVEVSALPSWSGSAKIFIEPRDVKREGVKRDGPAGEQRSRGAGEQRSRGAGGEGGGSLDKSEIPFDWLRAPSRVEGRNPKSEIAQWMVVGEVMATKPAWKRLRGSETDDELLQWLADGLGKWIVAKQKPAGQPPPAAARPQEWRTGTPEGDKARRRER